MKITYVGTNPTWIDTSWVTYDPGKDTQVTKGRNFGKVEPGEIFDVDGETAAQLLAQPNFVRGEMTATVNDVQVEKPTKPPSGLGYKLDPDESAPKESEVPLRH